jgi:hypothetical protein
MTSSEGRSHRRCLERLRDEMRAAARPHVASFDIRAPRQNGEERGFADAIAAHQRDVFAIESEIQPIEQDSMAGRRDGRIGDFEQRYHDWFSRSARRIRAVTAWGAWIWSCTPPSVAMLFSTRVRP